jgi:uncharacterized protein
MPWPGAWPTSSWCRARCSSWRRGGGVLRRAPQRLAQADLALARVDLIDMSAAVVESASRLPDPMLRSLDAVHLATALLVSDDLDAVVTFDDRLAAAAAGHGLPVESPGRTP